MLTLVGGLLSNGLGIVADWFKHKREVNEAKTTSRLRIEEIKVRAAEKRATEGELSDIRWTATMAEGTITSWKDEYFAVVLSLPFICAMAGYPDVAQRAFEAFKTAPEWYQVSFLVAVGASFGVRIWERFSSKRV